MRTIQAPPFKLRNVRANANQVIEDELKIHATAEGMLYCCAKPTRKINLAHLDFVSNSTETALHSPVHQCNDTNAAEGMPVYRQNGINSWRRERDSNPRYGFPYSGFQDGWIEGVLSRIKGLEAGWMGLTWVDRLSFGNYCSPLCSPHSKNWLKDKLQGKLDDSGT